MLISCLLKGHFCWTHMISHRILWTVGLFRSCWYVDITVQCIIYIISNNQSQKAFERFLWLPVESSGEQWRQVNDQVFTLTHTNMKSLYCSPFLSLCLSSREPSRPTSLLPADWSSGLGLGREDEPLPPGLETLPLRLMQQDCTAVKTLLLRLRRTLQEVGYAHTDTSVQALLHVGSSSDYDINSGDQDSSQNAILLSGTWCM